MVVTAVRQWQWPFKRFSNVSLGMFHLSEKTLAIVFSSSSQHSACQCQVDPGDCVVQSGLLTFDASVMNVSLILGV